MSAALLLLACLGVLFGTASSYEVTGQVISHEQAPVDFFNTRVVLNDGLFSTLVTSSGHFKFEDIPARQYHLSVYSPNVKFRQYKVDVATKKGGTIRAVSRPFPGGEKKLETYPLQISPIGVEAYFRPKAGVNPLRMIFGNPLMLFGIVAFGLTYFSKSLLPEETEGEGEGEGEGG